MHTSLGRAAKCLERGDGERVQESQGLLTRADGGDYATVFSFKTDSRVRLTYRLLVPAPNADWLVQIVDLPSGTVLAQAFSTSSRVDLTADVSRASEYGIVLNAAKPGRYRSNLTMAEIK